MTCLYRAAEIAAMPLDKGAVSIVGSQPAADAVWKLGKPATTWAPRWQDDWTFELAGRNVVLMPERDPFGWACARELSVKLYGWVKTLRWIVLPSDEGHGVLWWLERDGDLAALTRLVTATPMLIDGQACNEREFDRVWSIQHPKR